METEKIYGVYSTFLHNVDEISKRLTLDRARMLFFVPDKDTEAMLSSNHYLHDSRVIVENNLTPNKILNVLESQHNVSSVCIYDDIDIEDEIILEKIVRDHNMNGILIKK